MISVSDDFIQSLIQVNNGHSNQGWRPGEIQVYPCLDGRLRELARYVQTILLPLLNYGFQCGSCQTRQGLVKICMEYVKEEHISLGTTPYQAPRSPTFDSQLDG